MYSEHPSEFPLDTLPAMIDPALLIVSLLLLGLVGVGAWIAGRRAGRRAARDGGGAWRGQIHKAIHDAAQAAMKANRNEVIVRAEALHAVIQRRLGDVLALTGSLTVADALRRALDGEATGAGHGGRAVPGCGSIIINSGKLVVARTSQAETAAPAGDGAPAAERARLSHDETVDAVRQAVDRFADHWSDKPARLEELRRAQIQMMPRT